MKNLLRADFFRVIKSKLSLISIIAASALPFLVAVLIYLINLFIIFTFKQDYGNTDGVESVVLTSSMFIKASLSVSSNVGIAIPIFGSIFISMDFSNGSIRNKIICGRKRSEIYLSHLVVSICYNVTLLVVYFLFTIIFTSIFLPYGTEFNRNEMLNLLYMFINGVFSIAFVATITTFFSFTFKSVAPTIILTILILYVVTLIPFFQFFVDDYVIFAIPLLANGSYVSMASSSQTFDIDSILFFEGIMSLIVFGGLNTLAGIYKFKKSDIK